jgi:HD superfamily phosphohydrolase YqeK
MNIREHVAFLFWKKEMGDQKHDIHCGAVIEACLGMIKNTNMKEEIFIIAGWIHDMGKLVDKEKHHIESLKYLDKFLENYPEYKKWDFELRDCIQNHRTGCNPETLYGEIMKVADKVSLKNIDWLEFKKN